MSTKLQKLGYSYEKGTRGKVVITALPRETIEQEIIDIMYHLFPKNQMDQNSLIAFAIFISLFLTNDDFATMPWATRMEILSKYGVDKCEKTYRNWISKLIDKNIVNKSKNNEIVWKTEKTDCGNVQLKVTKEESQSWFDRKHELIEQRGDECDIGRVMRDLWKETHCCYYYPPSFVLSAFADEDYELLNKLYGLCVYYFYENY